MADGNEPLVQARLPGKEFERVVPVTPVNRKAEEAETDNDLPGQIPTTQFGFKGADWRPIFGRGKS